MPHQRVLFLGPTGVDKATVAGRLSQHAEANFGQQFRYVDFENQFLKRRLQESASRNWMTFLAQDIPVQASTWRRAWDDFKATLDGGITVLSMHATYVSGVLGLRCPVHIPSVCEEFRPTLIVNLIDDVFSMWRRTEIRAGGEEWKGRPTFEQLLMARRSEQILGDLILSHTGTYDARHVLCATGNTIDALSNLIVFDAGVTYLSFPISAPRKLAKKGDNSFIKVINEAHHKAAEEMQRDHSRAFISPLAIDELPMVFGSHDSEEAEMLFDCSADRWNLQELWGAEPLVPSLEGKFTFPREEVHAAERVMQTDVGWRDRRLVQQSSSLAIVCPKPPGENRITRGVRDEIETAAALGTVCYLWQNPEWDAENFVGKQFPPAGSMGIGQSQALVKRVETLDELIRSKP